jgi:endonuclease/exonuclease/phosphatase family metal-dependent hydrolase
MRIRIMTWNIWAGRNWKQVIDFVMKHKIDVMGFQEVDRKIHERSNYEDLYQNMKEALGFHGAFGSCIEKEVKGEKGQYGNCIFSRYPIVGNKVTMLIPDVKWTGDAETEPRCLLQAEIEVGEKRFTFMTMHIGYEKYLKRSAVRDKQFSTATSAVKGRTSTVLVGDFNTVPESKYIKDLSKHMTSVGNHMTWPTRDWEYHGWRLLKGPLYKIDYIFVSKDMKYSEPATDVNEISDHAPVMLTIEV